jgi:hypothetical protein
MPKNTVIAGDYEDKFIINSFGTITINTMFKTLVEIN